jgi:DNA replication protein DnaC
MLDNQTIDKMNEMLLTTMAKHYRLQAADPAIEALGFDERLGLLVDAEWTSRKTNRQKKLLQGAKLAYYDATLEGIEYLEDRKLDRAKITKFGTCNYIDECRNIVILGATGCGKTYVANALGAAACRKFYSVKYIRLSELVAELSFARATSVYKNVLKRYKQVKLLIIDDWLLYPLSATDGRELLEIIEARYKKGSTIFCSQIDIGGWIDNLGGESVVAEAICDRIAPESHKIVMSGTDSMRKRHGLPEEE